MAQFFPFHAKQSSDYAKDVDISKLWAATSCEMLHVCTCKHGKSALLLKHIEGQAHI